MSHYPKLGLIYATVEILQVNKSLTHPKLDFSHY